MTPTQTATPLNIIAHIHAKPDAVDLVKAELIKLIAPTLNEAGCLRYDLQQDNNDPAHFMFFETWQDRESWQAHMQADALKAYSVAVEGAIASFSIAEMTQIVI